MRPSAAALVAIAALAALAVVAAPRPARAHQASLTHSEVRVDGAEVRYEILIAPPDLAEALGLPPDTRPAPAELAAGEARVVAYVTGRIHVFGDDADCGPTRGVVGLSEEHGFARVAWTAVCPAPVTELAILYDLFFDLDATHEAVLRVHAGDHTADTVLRAGAARFVWDLAEPPPSGFLAFLRSGVDHIAFGIDHVAFVLALLLVIVVRREPAGWGRKPLRPALRDTAVIVTSFTVAHSITLIAASLGWVAAPERLVESAIALSIAYTAVENVVRPDVRWRFVVTFAFGLLHGLGFARMLEVMLPPDDVVLPLLAFNLGVELGQLAIVAVALPLLWALAGAVGAPRYRARVMPAISLALAVLGLLWLIERLFDVTIFGL